MVLRLCGAPRDARKARVRLFRPLRAAWWSDLDERFGPELPIDGDALSVLVPANDVVTVRIG
jgi:hypothetical protein